MSPDFGKRSYGNGDRVDQWIHHHGGGMEPLMTPMVVDQRLHHETWDDVGQSDWREIIDHFLQHADLDDPLFPPTPDGRAR